MGRIVGSSPRFTGEARWEFGSLLLHRVSRKFPAAAAAAKSLQSCPTLCDPIDGSPPGSSRPWDSPGKSTGVGCHFPLQRTRVKSESEVAQSCPTLSDRIDCSLPGSFVHGIFQARVLEWGAIAFSGKFPENGSKCKPRSTSPVSARFRTGDLSRVRRT